MTEDADQLFVFAVTKKTKKQNTISTDLTIYTEEIFVLKKQHQQALSHATLTLTVSQILCFLFLLC